MKKLLKLLAVLVILLIVAVTAVVLSIDSIARRAVEVAGTHALGTPTTLSGMHIGILDPSASMKSLAVANPTGYSGGSPHFLSLQSGAIAVDAKSLMGDVIHVPSIRLSDLSLDLVQVGGESNAGVILANMKRSLGGGSGAPTSSSSGRRFVIDELLIENISISAKASGLPMQAPAANLKVARIKLTSLGSAGKDPVGMDQLVAIVMNAVMQAAIEAGASQLPRQLVEGMLGGIAGLGGGTLSNFGLSIDNGNGFQPVGDLGSIAQRVGIDLSALPTKGAQEIQKGLGDVGRKLEDAGTGAGETVKKGLDDLLKKK